MRELRARVLRENGEIIGYDRWDQSMGWTHVDLRDEPSEDGSPWVRHGTLPDAFPERFIRELWTGLKDREGTDIYEGDILEWSEKDEESGDVEIYREAVCWLYDSWGNTFCDLGDIHLISKVIGNIHENPDLLVEEAENG